MKTVIEMARKAGMVYREFENEFANANTDGVDVETLERFAEFVRADEREACAKVCDDIDAEYEGEDVLATWCSQAIRARGNT